MFNSFNRRSFIRNSALAGAGMFLLPDRLKAYSGVKKSRLRMGLIGVGLRGQNHLDLLLRRDDVDVIALADPDKEMMADAQKAVREANKKAAVEYRNGNHDYKNLLKRVDIDAVIIDTHW